MINYIKTKLDSRRKYTIDKFKPIQIMSKFLHKVEHYCRIVSHLEERNAIHMIQRFNLIDKIKNNILKIKNNDVTLFFNKILILL